MKRSNKSSALILASTLLLAGAGSALAYGSQHGMGDCERHGSPMRALSRIDNLTDEQRARIKDLVKEQRTAMLEQKDAMQESRQALRDAMRNGATKDELQALADKQGKQVSTMIMARAQMRDKINAILTEEQRAELKKMQQERRDRYDNDERDRW